MPSTETKDLAREGVVWSFINYIHEVFADRKDIKIVDLLVYLRKFIIYLKAGSSEAELMLLSFVIQMSLYSTYITVESINLKRSYFELL